LLKQERAVRWPGPGPYPDDWASDCRPVLAAHTLGAGRAISIIPAGRIWRPWNVLQYLPRHAWLPACVFDCGYLAFPLRLPEDIGTGAHKEAAVSELTREQAREKAHEHLVDGLRLIPPKERVKAFAAALLEVETAEKRRQSAETMPTRH
jgi:hypothetical protein